jgi:ATP-binding cassette, subfamily C (CFTR/MRP), member 1
VYFPQKVLSGKSDTDGTSRIDGLNISTIGLLDLRRRLAIIPQDAAMFQGTIRDNLDPRHVHDDTELWSVLGTS